MSFHRFEDNKTRGFAPHLSTSKNALIDGQYLYFNLNTKPAGTGSEPHYHPNELLVFCLRGRINGLVGMERNIIEPGTFVVVPPNARHSFKATEESDCAYLYIKDHTWTPVGVAEDEALPDQATSIEDARLLTDAGEWTEEKKAPGKSTAITDGFASCFYKVLETLEQPLGQCERKIFIRGSRITFGLYEFPGVFERASDASENEQFLYMLSGTVNASVNGEQRKIGEGDIVKILKGTPYRLTGNESGGARYTVVRSTALMEQMVDAQGEA